MAEIEEVAEFSEEAEAGFEDAAAEDAEDAEDLDPEEKEELENEVDESKESAGKMQKVIDSVKELDVVQVLKKFTVFVAKQAAIAVVFFGVNVALSKMYQQSQPQGRGGGGESQGKGKQKLKKTKALSSLISGISTAAKTLTDWLKSHQSDTITVGMGISVPLTDIFMQYTVKIEQSVKVSYEVGKEIMKKSDSGKVQFLIPTIDQISKVVESSQDFISALEDFLKYAKQQEENFPKLKTVPLNQSNMDKLNKDLETVKELPY